MKKITRSDLKPNDEYEKTRAAFRAFVIQAKQSRRMTLGPRLHLLFENRRTLHYSLQEGLRLRGITEPEGIDEEIARTNALLPANHEIAATLFIEVTTPALGDEWLTKLRNIENCIALSIGDSINVRAFPVESRGLDDRTASVHYLKFRFPDTALDAFHRKKTVVRLFADHANYRYVAEMSPELLAEIRSEVSRGRRSDEEAADAVSLKIQPEDRPPEKKGKT